MATDRPPTQAAAAHAGASVRPTARSRPVVPVVAFEREGFEPSDVYVRRFWVAAIGTAAVAELLRLTRAAGTVGETRLPRSLPILLKAGLVTVSEGALKVGNRLPPVPTDMRWRFPPALAAEHARVMDA